MPVIEGPNIISVFTTSQLPLRFATNNGIGEVVTVKRGRPGPYQTWFVKAVEGIPDVYTITVGQFPPKLGTPGFRREIDSDPNDVISSPLRGHWRFVPVGPHGVFEVHPVDHIIGVEELLGTEGDKVVIQTFLIGPDAPDIKKPAWQFVPTVL